MQARALAHEQGGAPLSALHARVPGCPRTLAIAARSAIVCFGLNFMPSSTSCMSSRPWRTSLRKTWPRSLVSWCPGTRLVPPTSRLLFWWLGGNGGEGGGEGGSKGTRAALVCGTAPERAWATARLLCVRGSRRAAGRGARTRVWRSLASLHLSPGQPAPSPKQSPSRPQSAHTHALAAARARRRATARARAPLWAPGTRSARPSHQMGALTPDIGTLVHT